MHKLILNIICLLFINPLIFSQINLNQLQKEENNTLQTNFVQYKFSKQINVFNSYTKLNYRNKLGAFSYGIFDKFNSTVVDYSIKSIKDENHFSFFSEYKAHKNITAGIRFNNYYFSDNRNTGLNNSIITNAFLYLSTNFMEKVSFSPFAGFSSNKQIEIKDNGFLYGADLKINNINIENVNIKLNQHFQNEDVLPRRNLMRNSELIISNSDSETYKNEFILFYNRHRKDFYYDADSLSKSNYDIVKNIQSRNETNYYLENNLTYKPGIDNLTLEIKGKIDWRNIERNSRFSILNKQLLSKQSSFLDNMIDEFKMNFSIGSIYLTKNFLSQIHFQYSSREENHSIGNLATYSEIQKISAEEIEKRKNNKADIFTMYLNAVYKIDNKNRISINTFHRKLKYDTPSNENFDDRDEILSTLKLNYEHIFNPYLIAFVNFEGSYNHVVYIFAEKSSNNNQRRIFKITTGANYKGKNLSSKNKFEVSANYTSYDFEKLNPNYKSFSYRQLALNDSTLFRINPDWSISFIGTAKFSEQGDFNWQQFSGKPIRYVSEIYLQPMIIKKFPRFNFSFGVRYFSLTTFKYSNNEKTLNTQYTSIGPIVDLSFTSTDKLLFAFTGWYEFIKRTTSAENKNANLALELNYFL